MSDSGSKGDDENDSRIDVDFSDLVVPTLADDAGSRFTDLLAWFQSLARERVRGRYEDELGTFAAKCSNANQWRNLLADDCNQLVEQLSQIWISRLGLDE
jgi:hypothetical protein